MVERREKHSRRYLGARRWGKGNIKNARGAGDRGGVGRGGRKHKFTYLTAKEPWRIRKKGFVPWRARRLATVSLYSIDAIADRSAASEPMPKVVLPGCKVVGTGEISRPVSVSADAFSKGAEQKIRQRGGEALVLKKQV